MNADPSEFVYVLRPTRPAMLTQGPTERERAVVAEHFNYLKSLCEQGTVVLAGRTITNDERTFGLCVFRAASEPAARALVMADPAVRENIMTADLHPFRVAMLTTGH